MIENFAKEFVSLLMENEWIVYLFPTTRSDLVYMLEKIGLKEFPKIKTYQNYTEIDSSLEFLESLDIFVGQRLHSVIFSAAVSTPFFAIEYEPKTSDFLESIDMADYSERVDNLNPKVIFEIVNEMYQNIDNEQAKVFKNMSLAKKEQVECIHLFLSKL